MTRNLSIMEKKYVYDGFISYLQVPDKQLAIAIRNGLMQLGAKKHLLKFRALEIFRDESSMAGQGGLEQRIHDGMDNSRFLLLLARPEIIPPYINGHPNWVQEELVYWVSKVSSGIQKENQEEANALRAGQPYRRSISPATLNIIICIMDGSIHWEETPSADNSRPKGTFLTGPDNCLNEVLKDELTVEPKWVDFRKIYSKLHNYSGAAPQEIYSLKDPDFLQKIAEVSGLIQGKSVDELIAEDRRRQLLWANVLIACAAALFILGGVAVYQYRHAVRNRRNAEQNLRNYELKKLEEVISDARIYYDAAGALGISKTKEMVDSAYRIIKRYPDDTAFVVKKTQLKALSK